MTHSTTMFKDNFQFSSEHPHQVHFFQFLKPEEVELIHQNRIEVAYKAKETILKQGTLYSHVVFFNQGFAKIHIEGLNNKNFILSLVKAGDFVGGPGLHDDSRHYFSLSTLTDSVVSFVEIKYFKQIFSQNSQFADEFLKMISQKSVATYKKLISLSQKQMHGRVAECLLNLSEKVFNTNSFDLILSRQELADMTGISLESISRIMQEFKADGLIDFKGKKLEILNPKTLNSISTAG